MPESPVASVEHLPSAVVIHVLAREMRKSEVDGLCAAVDQARVAAPSLPFILDMAGVDFAGSLALGVLVGLNQEFRTRGQRLIFVSLQKGMRRAVDIARINRIMEIMQDVHTALRSIGGDD
jgi:anti-anti-sigma factor